MTATNLYLFNPESDLALANFSATYTPPPMAVKLKYDAELLPLWYAERASVVAVQNPLSGEYAQWVKELFGIEADTIPYNQLGMGEFAHILPWGWNPLVCRTLSKLGIDSTLLPNADKLKQIKDFSNRKHAVRLLEEMRQQDASAYCGTSFLLTDIDDVLEHLSAIKGDAVLKMPNSGSGKGLMWIKGNITDKQTDWCKRVIATQGAVVVEPTLDKVVDCAMEFRIHRGECAFVGYSLFDSTASGAYCGNRLMSDNNILHVLSTHIPQETWLNTQSYLTRRLAEQFPTYDGYLGVDMMVCCDGSTYRLQPMVEINLRMNMGLVARFFFDTYVREDCQKGIYRVAYFKQEGEALQFDKAQRQQYPLVVNQHRIEAGYLSLNPVDNHTRYVAYVEVRQ